MLGPTLSPIFLSQTHTLLTITLLQAHIFNKFPQKKRQEKYSKLLDLLATYV